MDIVTAFALVFLVGLAAAWIHEQRVWKRFHTAPVHEPGPAALLHTELLRAGVRVRFKSTNALTVTALSHQLSTVVLVHRDDVHHAERVREDLRQRGEL